MKKLKKLAIVCFLFFAVIGIRSYAHESKGIYIVSPNVPEKLETYAKEIVEESIINFMTGNSNADIYINNSEDLFMGNGFYAFDSMTGNPIMDIVYFPIYESNRYVLTLAITENQGKIDAFMSNYFDSGFQKIEKNTLLTPYAVLYDGDKSNYLLTETGNVLLQGPNKQEISMFSSENLLADLKQSYDVNNVEEEYYKINIDYDFYSNYAAGPQGFSVNTSTTKRLDMSNCLLLQYDKPICWAASLGTAYRYRTGNRSVDATDICDMLGMPYSGIDPSIVYQKYNILNVAGGGNSYSYKAGVATPFNVQHNINNMFPLHLHTEGHGMLVEGYLMSNGAVHLYYWDSAVGKTIYTATGYTENTIYAYLLGAGKSRRWFATTLIQ